MILYEKSNIVEKNMDILKFSLKTLAVYLFAGSFCMTPNRNSTAQCEYKFDFKFPQVSY